MSRPINISDTLTFNPTGYTGETNMTISSASQGYHGSDWTTNYATVSVSSTTAGYIYFTFSISDIPSNATITSVTCSVRERANQNNRVSNASIQLYNNTTAKGSATSTSLTTTATVYNITNANAGTWTISDLSNIRLRINGQRASSNSSGSIRFYGATLSITYSIQGTEYEINASSSTNLVSSIDPSGQTWVASGDDYELAIYTNSVDAIIVKDNNTDVTSSLVETQPSSGGTVDRVLGEYTLDSGSFNGSGASFFQGLVGKGVDSSTTTSNYYSGGSSTIAVFHYDLSFTDIPSNATITRVYCQVNGHAESTSQNSEYMCVQLVSGSTELSAELNFKSIGTSNSTQTIEATTLPTISQLANMQLKCRLGYYGGAINGATCYVVYTTPLTGTYYVYTISNVSADHTITITEDNSTKYQITASSSFEEAIISPASSLVPEGTSKTLTLSVNAMYMVVVTDNNVNVTSQFSGSNGTFTYTISNIQEAHTILVEEASFYEITARSWYNGATITASKTKVYVGHIENVTLTLTTTDISVIIVMLDNETNITSSFSGSSTTYTYTLTNIQASHSILVIEKPLYEITCLCNTENAQISPSGVSSIREGNNFNLAITAEDIDLIIVTDNNEDVTEDLIIQQSQSTSTSATIDASIYDSANSSYDYDYNDSGTNDATNGVYADNVPANGATGSSSTTRACVFSNTGSGATSQLVYKFDVSSIPLNATITSVTCEVKAAYYNNTSVFSTHIAQLYSGNTAKGSSISVTGTGGTASTHTVNGGTSWTRNELNDVNIRYIVTRSNSNTTTAGSFSFWGATLTVNYITPAGEYYQYSLSNVTQDHTIVVSEIFIPEEEDPQYEYHYLTVSSINATTDPGKGTTRVIRGTAQTILIYPSDPTLTLATDNGTDISGQLVYHAGTQPSYTVTTQVTGAGYGFTLNNNTGYYVSGNAGQSSSTALARINLDLPTACLVTIKYINYAEEGYDFGVFSKVDTALSTSAWNSSSSGGDTTTDAGNEQIRLNTSSANTSAEQTLIYEVASGTHFIDVKYAKDQGADDNNDTLQWKIDSITPIGTSTAEYYEYTISQMSANHSLVFIFGNVTYYFVNSSGTNCKLYPNGSIVQLPGDEYFITIVPDNINYGIKLYDNNVDVSTSVKRSERTITKNNEQITVVNYTYLISNIQATHNIVVECSPNQLLHLKVNGSFVQVSAVYKKVNGSWVEQTEFEDLFDTTKIYVKA